MTAEARRLLHALLEHTGARIEVLDRRVEALERVMFHIDNLEARIARLEQGPPTALGRRKRQREGDPSSRLPGGKRQNGYGASSNDAGREAR